MRRSRVQDDLRSLLLVDSLSNYCRHIDVMKQNKHCVRVSMFTVYNNAPKRP